jgi:putative acetyltransferase
VRSLDATRVDVNEQNEQAVGFYQRMRFGVEGRSELDSQGKPFPLLHMRLGRL